MPERKKTMLDETSILKEISRLRQQLHFIYKRDNRISAAALDVSIRLDKQINAFMQINNGGINPTRPPHS